MKSLLFAATLLALPALAQAADCSSRNPEPFGPFLQRFSTETAFALKRTRLPLTMLKWEYGQSDGEENDPAPVKSHISRAHYLEWPALAAYMQKNGLTSVIHSQTRTTAILKVYKDSTDWQTLYHFRMRRGCWLFWQYEDQSL